MDETSKKGMNPLVSGMTGAVIGAGVAVVATKVLSDKKTRNQIKTTLFDIRDKVVSYAKKAGKQARKQQDIIEHRLRRARKAGRRFAT